VSPLRAPKRVHVPTLIHPPIICYILDIHREKPKERKIRNISYHQELLSYNVYHIYAIITYIVYDQLISSSYFETTKKLNMMAAKHQRIHHVHDVKAPHGPLVPQNIAKSYDKGIPHLTFLVMHSKPPKRRRSYCYRFMCWTLSILLILIIVIAITIVILYLVFRPKLPKYSVDQLHLVHKA